MKYNNELINFFKRHNLYDEEMFKYLQDHSDMIDYNDEEVRMFLGAAYEINEKNNKLNKFRICLPYVNSYVTMLNSIHEIVHGIIAYKYLNKEFNKNIDLECLPLLYEKIYISETNDESLDKYGKYLDSKRDSSDEERYKFALYARDYLYDNYDKNINNMEKMSYKLIKKYNKEHK